MSYEGSDDEEKLKTVPAINQNNNNYNVVSDSKSDNEGKENLLMRTLMRILMKNSKQPPRPLSTQKWYME